MSFFEWAPKYELHVDDMDGEHRVLIAKMNRTYELVAAGAPVPEQLQAFDDFIDYTAGHFRDEEKYMRSFAYPHLDMHCASHRAFVESLQGFRKEMAGGALADKKLFEFLARWLTGHILGVDMRYAKFAQERALRTS